MSGGKRAPSSSVKKATARGRRVVTPAPASVSTTSSPASTPRLPSYRPPVRTVSMWEPVMTGARSSRPARTPTTLPTASIVTSRPRSRIHSTHEVAPGLVVVGERQPGAPAAREPSDRAELVQARHHAVAVHPQVAHQRRAHGVIVPHLVGGGTL